MRLTSAALRRTNTSPRSNRRGAGRRVSRLSWVCVAGKGGVTAKPIADTGAETLEREIAANVEAGATIYTDEHASYRNLSASYQHGKVKHSVKEYVNEMAHTNGIESVWAVIKRGYNGVYHHWSFKHMARYVNEFTFRLNEGNVERHTLERLDSLVSGAFEKRLTYQRLTE